MKNLTSYPLSYFFKIFISKSNKKITQKQYGDIIRLSHQLISKGIVEDNFIFSPPYLKCKFRIKKYKQKIKLDPTGKIIKSNLPVNWKATKEYWQKNPKAKENKVLIYHLNDHSDGYRYRFSKAPLRHSIKNLAYYNFKPCRNNDRALAKQILNPYNKTEYYE
jgi:hypothetical protein